MVFEKIMPHVDSMVDVGESDEDFLLGSIISEIQTSPMNNLIIPAGNQATELGGKLSHFCTGFNPFRILNGLEGKTSIGSDIRALYWQYAQEKGYIQGRGNHTATGVHVAQKFVEEEFGRKYLYFRTMIGDNDYMTAVKKRYATVVSYRGNGAYNADYKVDGRLDGVNFGSPTYGHATIHHIDKEAKINDSYDGTPNNNYVLGNLPALVANSVFYRPAYIYIPDPKGILEDKVKAYKEEVAKARAWVMAQGISNGDNPEGTVTREQFWVTLYRQAHE